MAFSTQRTNIIQSAEEDQLLWLDERKVEVALTLRLPSLGGFNQNIARRLHAVKTHGKYRALLAC